MKEVVKNVVCKLRQDQNLTQEELGKKVGVTRQTIIAIEKGNYTPSVALAIKIAKYFNKSVEQIFTIDE